MTDEARKFGGKNLRYKLDQWKKTVTFDILNNISEYIALVQLMDSVGNVNHAVSVVGGWIFGSNDRKSFTLNIESLDLIFAYSDEEDYFEKFL